jgi:hypothetical protein
VDLKFCCFVDNLVRRSQEIAHPLLDLSQILTLPRHNETLLLMILFSRIDDQTHVGPNTKLARTALQKK